VWAIARYDFGLPEDEIGRLNFLEFDALMRRKGMADDRLRLNAGFIYAAINNTAQGDPNRKAVQPADIVPSMHPEETPTYNLREMAPELQSKHVHNVFAAFAAKNT